MWNEISIRRNKIYTLLMIVVLFCVVSGSGCQELAGTQEDFTREYVDDVTDEEYDAYGTDNPLYKQVDKTDKQNSGEPDDENVAEPVLVEQVGESVSTTYTNSIGMEFVLIPAGNFQMGSPEDEVGREDFESPLHEVFIEQDYYLGIYEVTQEQWTKVMGTNPSYFGGSENPVEMISWYDAQQFIDKLNEMEGTEKYRLPSEAEWEYACRAGTTTEYYFGDEESELGEYAWYLDNSGDITHPVGQKKPNQWGLYDIYGNVWEWCQDKRHDSYDGAPVDGSAWEVGSIEDSRVIRGGAIYLPSENCRSARRGYGYSPGQNKWFGFRVAMDISENGEENEDSTKVIDDPAIIDMGCETTVEPKEETITQPDLIEEPENSTEATTAPPNAEGNVISYDDGEMDGYAGWDDEGHTIFVPIDENMNITSVNIYSGRYNNESHFFEIEIWDENLNTLYSGQFEYTDYYPKTAQDKESFRNNFEWITVDIPDLEVNDDIYVCFFTNSDPPSWVEPEHFGGGIEVAIDSDGPNIASLKVARNPNRIEEINHGWADELNWMMRVTYE